MVATVNPIEAIGPPPGVTDVAEYIHVLQDDAFSLGESTYTLSPLLPNEDGSPSTSMERWVRFRFTQPFTQVFDFFFYMPGLVVPTGWTLRYGTALTYQTPTNGPSAIATGPVPTSKPLEPNAGGLTPLNGDVEQYSDWIVLQATVNGDAPVGPLRGFNLDNSRRPLDYRFDWTEI